MDLYEYLFRKKVSQTDFANELEISRNYLGEIFRGRRSHKEEAMFSKE